MLLFLFVLAPSLIFIQIGIAPPVISLGTHENTLAVSVVLFCNFATYSCKYFLVVVICWENSYRLAVSLISLCLHSEPSEQHQKVVSYHYTCYSAFFWHIIPNCEEYLVPSKCLLFRPSYPLKTKLFCTILVSNFFILYLEQWHKNLAWSLTFFLFQLKMVSLN